MSNAASSADRELVRAPRWLTRGDSQPRISGWRGHTRESGPKRSPELASLGLGLALFGQWEMQSLQVKCCGFDVVADRFDGGKERQVLLIHGLGGNRITWRRAASLVAERERATVWAVDLPGFGGTRVGQRRTTLALLERVLVEFAKVVGSPGVPWEVWGNSLGGIFALRLAQCERLKVTRVVLSSIALPLVWGRPRESWSAPRQFVPSALPYSGRHFVARYVLGTGVPGVVDDPIRMLFGEPKRLDPDTRQELIDLSSERLTWAHEAARALEIATLDLGLALIVPWRIARLIRTVRCPVVSIYGDHDPIYPLSAWQRLREIRPDWRHVRLPGVGHIPQLEAPVEFVQSASDAPFMDRDGTPVTAGTA